MRFFVLTFFIVVLSIMGCDEQAVEKKEKKKKSHFVETALADYSTKPFQFIATGILVAEREVEIVSREEGILNRLPFYEGDEVKKDDLLAKLDDELLRAQLNRAQALYDKTKQDLKRVTTLHQQKLASEENLNDAEVAVKVANADLSLLKTRLSYTTIKAPFSGVISQRKLEPGNVVEKFTHILTLTDPESLLVEATLSDLLVRHIDETSQVRIVIDALGGDSMPGQVTRIHPSLDPTTHQARTEIKLARIPDGARAGQLCRVQFQTAAANRLLIPFRALRRDETTEYVYTVSKNGKVTRKDVTSGIRIDEETEIISGLSAGDQVITKGFLGLKSGKAVVIVNQTTTAQDTKN